ncbi:unnamed protein product [Ambrosiozyma monospora]|uniref:Unnamed protein product n=1 Tax=Ambrosiozyma monospora TaxID=43982 RepID=A0A9W6YYF7_AMBMO|nr:unnamed protein product [Ambrosiozyma monospora]
MSGTIYKTPNGLLPYHQTPTGSPGAKDLRLVVIGDSGCGKTSLLINYKDGKPASYEDYIPTIFETYNCFVTNQESGKTYKLSLHDTAGQEDFEGLRTPVYAEIDMVIACYSIDSSVSLANIQDVWIPEVQQTKPDVPIVLVATKSDLKDQLSPEQIVTPEEEKRVANAIGVIGHVQASAVTTENVKTVFDICIAEYSNKLARQNASRPPAANSQQRPAKAQPAPKPKSSKDHDGCFRYKFIIYMTITGRILSLRSFSIFTPQRFQYTPIAKRIFTPLSKMKTPITEVQPKIDVQPLKRKNSVGSSYPPKNIILTTSNGTVVTNGDGNGVASVTAASDSISSHDNTTGNNNLNDKSTNGTAEINGNGKTIANGNGNQPKRVKAPRIRRKRAKKENPDPTAPKGVLLTHEIPELLKEHNLTMEDITNPLNDILNDESLKAIYNDRLVENVKILKYTSNGDGLALIPNPHQPETKKQVVIVPFAMPGDIVTIKVFITKVVNINNCITLIN